MFVFAGIAALALVAGLVWYVAALLRRLLALHPRFRRSQATTLPLLALAVAIVVAAAAVRGAAAAYVLYAVLAALAVDALWLAARFRTRLAARKRSGAGSDGEDARNSASPRKLAAVRILAPILVAALATGYGMRNMGQVARTDYTVVSDKLSRTYTVLFVSDLHYATVQDPDVLAQALDGMRAAKPDLVVLGGDIVDEGTPGNAMPRAFEELAGVEAPLGTYFVWGNHDSAEYSAEPAFTAAEVEAAARAAGIGILADETAQVAPGLVLAGRKDYGFGASGRESARELLSSAHPGDYAIIADHQPGAGAEEAAKAGADLQLSGHTHAMQIFPAGQIARAIGAYVHGRYETGGLTLIVSSGFAGWGVPVRTEAHCEYVVVRLEPAR